MNKNWDITNQWLNKMRTNFNWFKQLTKYIQSDSLDTILLYSPYIDIIERLERKKTAQLISKPEIFIDSYWICANATWTQRIMWIWDECDIFETVDSNDFWPYYIEYVWYANECKHSVRIERIAVIDLWVVLSHSIGRWKGDESIHKLSCFINLLWQNCITVVIWEKIIQIMCSRRIQK